MSAPQWTFVIVTALITSGGTIFTYPGVRAHARSPSYSLLAAAMASTLTALPLAMLAGGLVNVFWQGLHP